MILDFFKKFILGNRQAKIDVKQLVFLDIETTGLFTNRCGILEICLFDDNNGMLSTLVDVGRSIPARISEINGIDRDMIVGKPFFSDIACQIQEKIKGKIVVGHNVEFDLKFLFHEFLEAGIQPEAQKYICTCKTERAKFGYTGNKLNECLCRRGIYLDQKHRALEDVNLLRQLFDCQLKERLRFHIEVFDGKSYNAIVLREPAPMFTQAPKKRTTHTLKMFEGWGSKSDDSTISMFNQFIEEACQDRVFDTDEMHRLTAIGIEKRAAVRQLKKALQELVKLYYNDSMITWDEYADLEEVAKLFGFNSSTFFPLVKAIVPDLKVVCFTNDLIVKGETVDRHDVLFPWAVRNGFLPSDSVTKQTDLVVNCGSKNSDTGKIQKAKSYGASVTHISALMKGKERFTP